MTVQLMPTKAKQVAHDTATSIRDGVSNRMEKADNAVTAAQKLHNKRKLSRDNRGIMSEIRLIGGGLIMVLIVALVLTEVYDAVEVAEGPFSGVVDSLETTGAAALTLLVVGFLVIAAVAIMRFFNRGGWGAR